MFDDIRNEELEKGAPSVINLVCDEVNQYDYQTDKDSFCESVGAYYEMIIQEIQQLSKEEAKSLTAAASPHNDETVTVDE